MMTPKISHCDPERWPHWAAGRIQEEVDATLRGKGRCSVMLTGGRSAQRLYTAWADLAGFQKMAGTDFYFGDERCVPPHSEESNYGMAMSTLFQKGIPKGCTVQRMEADVSDQEAAARCYEKNLPAAVDVLLLGVGEDGHIASLFPGSATLNENQRTVVPVVGPKTPCARLTITPHVIVTAHHVFLLATGPAKISMLGDALARPEDVSTMPVRLAMQATWLLDTPLNYHAPPES